MKKYFSLLLTLVISLVLAACMVVDRRAPVDSSGGAPNMSENISPTDSESGSPTPSPTTPAPPLASTPAPTPSPSPTPAPDTVPTSFSIGDTLVFQENYEIKMKSMEFATRVDPPNPDSFYTYYEVKDSGKIYIHSVFEVKNLRGNNLSSDEILSVKITYDGKYSYTSFSVIEKDGGGDFTYTGITGIAPLTVGVLHFMAEVPLEVRDSGARVELSIAVSNKAFTCIGETDNPATVLLSKQNKITNSNTSWQKYQVLTDGETVIEDGYAEMTIKKADFTSTVKPTNPGRFYSYYEVKDSSLTYAHLVLSFKNLKPTSAEADKMVGVEIIYDNKYAYTGFSAIEENGGSNLRYTNITRIDPLTSGTIHYMVEVPLEVRDSGKSVVLSIKFNRANYVYVLIGQEAL